MIWKTAHSNAATKKISSIQSFKFYHSTHTYIWLGSISPYFILAGKLLNLNYCKLLSWLNCDCFCVCTGRSGAPNHYHFAKSAHYNNCWLLLIYSTFVLLSQSTRWQNPTRYLIKNPLFDNFIMNLFIVNITSIEKSFEMIAILYCVVLL